MARVIQLDRVCPACGAPPRLRVSPLLGSLVATTPSNAVVLTYQCHRQSCGRIYPVVASDFVRVG